MGSGHGWIQLLVESLTVLYLDRYFFVCQWLSSLDKDRDRFRQTAEMVGQMAAPIQPRQMQGCAHWA